MSPFCPAPAEERRRLDALLALNMLESVPSEAYDRMTRLASHMLDAPVAAVSLTDSDRQWFKSTVGTSERELPRHQAPCAVVSTSRAMLVVPDLQLDERFVDSPLARSGIRFYAGAPLLTRDGLGLGAMCVLDTKPRHISATEMQSLTDLAAMVMAQVELEHAFGRIDPTSGLPNRLQFVDEFAARPETDGVALMVDLSHSDDLGETVAVLGPAYAEAVTRHGAEVLVRSLGGRSGVYHTGGCVFLALLPDTRPGRWQLVVEELEAAFTEPVSFGDVPVTATPTFGIACFSAAFDAGKVLGAASSAAAEARANGCRVGLYDPDSDARSQRRLRLLSDMAPALAVEDQLSLVFQPRIDIATGRCRGAEALLRWQHPQLAAVSPGEFIPLVEQTALTQPVTRWVIRRAAAQLAAMRRDGVALGVSVNVSALNLAEPDFTRHLLDTLEQHGLEPQALELEFTESALIRNGDAALKQMRELRAMGVEIAIDDFGTGYSTFSYIQTLPANIIKLDQSFIRSLATSKRDQRLVATMIQLAHDLGHRVVAEGVEDQGALDFLARHGCDEAQGYLIARPLVEPGLRAWLLARGAAERSGRQ